MTRLLSLFFAAALSFNAIAADDQPDRKLSLEYLKASKMEEVVNTTIDTYTQQFSQMEAFKDLSAANHAVLKKLMTETMGWEAIKPQMVDLIGGVYTKAEIRAAIAFMRTKHGASMTSKQELFSRQMVTVLSKNIEKALDRCMEQAKAIQQERLVEK